MKNVGHQSMRRSKGSSWGIESVHSRCNLGTSSTSLHPLQTLFDFHSSLGMVGISHHHNFHRSTRNPHNPKRIDGGSSSSSAAVVAAGLCPTALGVEDLCECLLRFVELLVSSHLLDVYLILGRSIFLTFNCAIQVLTCRSL